MKTSFFILFAYPSWLFNERNIVQAFVWGSIYDTSATSDLSYLMHPESEPLRGDKTLELDKFLLVKHNSFSPPTIWYLQKPLSQWLA